MCMIFCIGWIVFFTGISHMDNVARIARLAEDKYQETFGVKKQTFDKMLAILEQKHAELRRKGGHKRQLSVLDSLVILFAHVRNGRAKRDIAFDYACYPQRITETVAWVMKTLSSKQQYRFETRMGLLRCPSKANSLKKTHQPILHLTIIQHLSQKHQMPQNHHLSKRHRLLPTKSTSTNPRLPL